MTPPKTTEAAVGAILQTVINNTANRFGMNSRTLHNHLTQIMKTYEPALKYPKTVPEQWFDETTGKYIDYKP